MATTVTIYDSVLKGMFDQPGGLRDHVQRKVDATVIAARAEAPAKSYALRRSIGSTYHGGGHWTVEASAPHARMVHDGTKPHVIRPKERAPKPKRGRRAATRKVLRFFWQREGRVVYLASVNHPGTKADPFMVRAMKRVWG